MRQSVTKNGAGEINKYNHSKWMTITGRWHGHAVGLGDLQRVGQLVTRRRSATTSRCSAISAAPRSAALPRCLRPHLEAEDLEEAANARCPPRVARCRSRCPRDCPDWGRASSSTCALTAPRTCSHRVASAKPRPEATLRECQGALTRGRPTPVSGRSAPRTARGRCRARRGAVPTWARLPRSGSMVGTRWSDSCPGRSKITESHDAAAMLSAYLLRQRPAEVGPGVLRRLVHGLLDDGVGDQALHPAELDAAGGRGPSRDAGRRTAGRSGAAWRPTRPRPSRSR